MFLARFLEVTRAAFAAAPLPPFRPDLARLTVSRGGDARPEKASFHFAYDGVHSELPAAQRDFWRRVWAGERERLYPEWHWLKERADGRLERREYVDLKVYDTDRQMCAVLATNCTASRERRYSSRLIKRRSSLYRWSLISVTCCAVVFIPRALFSF